MPLPAECICIYILKWTSVASRTHYCLSVVVSSYANQRNVRTFSFLLREVQRYPPLTLLPFDVNYSITKRLKLICTDDKVRAYSLRWPDRSARCQKSCLHISRAWKHLYFSQTQGENKQTNTWNRKCSCKCCLLTDRAPTSLFSSFSSKPMFMESKDLPLRGPSILFEYMLKCGSCCFSVQLYLWIPFWVSTLRSNALCYLTTEGNRRGD